MLTSCPRERDLRALLARGHAAQMPELADADLRAHAAACRSCSDLLLVAEAFRNARAASTASAQLVPPGVLWWRAQLRRRQAAIQQVTRRLLGAQIFALVLTLLVGVGFLAFAAWSGDTSLAWLRQLPQSAALHWDSFSAPFVADPAWGWMILGPALLLLTGVAIYMATDRQ